MSRLRVGVVGCGGIAQMMHLPYLRELDDRFELVALADTDADTLEQVANHYGVVGRYQDVDRLLAEPLDVVMVLTSGDHTDITLAALESGRHVMVEKPLAYTLRQTDEVIERARPIGPTTRSAVADRDQEERNPIGFTEAISTRLSKAAFCATSRLTCSRKPPVRRTLTCSRPTCSSSPVRSTILMC